MLTTKSLEGSTGLPAGTMCLGGQCSGTPLSWQVTDLSHLIGKLTDQDGLREPHQELGTPTLLTMLRWTQPGAQRNHCGSTEEQVRHLLNDT